VRRLRCYAKFQILRLAAAKPSVLSGTLTSFAALIKVRADFLAQDMLDLMAAECPTEGILPEQCKLLAQAV